MRKVITWVVVAMVTFSAIMLLSSSSENLAVLSGNNFMEQYQETPNAVLIDVRTPEEFSGGHIEGAINLDVGSTSFVSNIYSLDKSKTYFVYCRSGSRSAAAASMMRNEGLNNVFELQGGINSLNR